MTPSVKELVRARATDATERTARADRWHLALVIEGGGMRGVVTGGMVSALEERGLLRCFDSIHGSSAGACAAAYFGAGQAKIGTSIYYEDINNNSFIDVLRPLRGQPIMDTRFLIDHVMRDVKVLNSRSLIRQGGFINIVATDAVTGSELIFKDFRDQSEFFTILRGSITIPIIAGGPVSFGTHRLFDGGLVQQIALKSALQSGATHVLVLMTRKNGEHERPTGGLMRLDAVLLSVLYGKTISDLYRSRNSKINSVVKDVMTRSVNGIPLDYIARSENACEVGRLTKDYQLLRRAESEAMEAVFSYLDSD